MSHPSAQPLPTPSPQPLKRYLSRHVVVNGHDHGLAVLTICGDRFTVAPFTRELHSTAYTPEPITITASAGRIITVDGLLCTSKN